MITITVDPGPRIEYWDKEKEEFIVIEELDRPYTINLEHSLISVSLWESRWHIPFITKDGKHTLEQTLDYIKCMTITKNVPDVVYKRIKAQDVERISDYINDPMVAPVYRAPDKKKNKNQVVTSITVYGWMTSLQIPWQAEKWHYNRLLELIEEVNANNTPPEKMSKKEIMERNRKLNEERRKKYNSKG